MKLLQTAAFVFIASLSAAAADPPRKKELLDLLAEGYRDANPDSLGLFLEMWRDSAAPCPDDVFAAKPAFERAVYETFEAFYPSKLKSEKWVVVPGELEVHFVDGDVSDVQRLGRDPDVRRDPMRPMTQVVSRVTVHDFRPRIRAPKEKTLYSDDHYVVALLAFLGQGKPDLSKTEHWRRKNTGDEARARLKYVQSQLSVYPGHWGFGWHIDTCPIVGRVYLNLDLKSALLTYRSGYGGGEALMEKVEGKWTVARKGLSWIE